MSIYYGNIVPIIARTLASVVAMSYATSSFAQTSEETDAGSSVAEIVVTAQHREQRLQDVGIAVTALPSEALQQMGITSSTDLVRAVPTLKMNAYSSSQVVFNIRGVSQNDFGDQQEPPIAVYQDDSYASSINLASFPTFDLQRAEVLRGPQGTLFGRNATGGAVQFISNKPSKSLEGYATVTAGTFGQLVLEGAISGPLSNNLQVRIAGIRDRDKGYLKNINPGVKALGANNHYAMRGIIAWQPTDTINTTLTLRYMRAPKERQAGLYAHSPVCPNAQFQGEFLDPNTTCAYWVGFGTPGPGTTATGFRNDSINPQRGGNPWRTYRTGSDNYVDRKFYGATLKIEADLGGLDLVSITDVQHSKKFYSEDTFPDTGVIFYQGSKVDQYSQEIRFSGKSGNHQYVFGGFGMIIDGDYVGKWADPFISYDPLANFTQKTKSFAFFAQDEWAFAPRFKLIGGLRYWNDQRTGSYFVSEPSTGVSLTFNRNEVSYASFGVTQPSTGITVTPADAHPTFDGITARAELDYKPVDNALLYVSYNRGSKSGGFTFSTTTPYPGGEISALNGTPYEPETLNAYEAGIKWSVNRNTTFNVTGFYYDYRDYQAFAQSGLVQTVLNLDAVAHGLEAELNTTPIKGLTLRASASFLSSKVKDVPLPDGVSIVDHDLPQAPGFSGTLFARYEIELPIGMKASIQGDIMHSGKSCFTVLCAPDENEPAYDVANARIGLADIDDKWEIAGFVNNLTSKKYRTYGLDESLFDGDVLGAYAKPRTWGVTATYRFGGGY